jgi:DNA excision repair protein ERCC-4
LQERSDDGPLLRKIKKSKQEYLQQLSVLSSLPGVGSKLGARMLEEFNTPKRALNASVAELAKIPGFGRMRAQKVREVLDKKSRKSNEEGQPTLLEHMK